MNDEMEPRLTWTMSLGLLILRVHAGLSICSAGFDKIPVTWFDEQVAELGFPQPMLFAWAAVLAEFVGGALLLIGLYTRLSAFFLAVTMGVAAFLFHKVTPVLECQIAQLYFFVFLAFLFTGAGRLSFDYWLQRGRQIGARWRSVWPMLILIALAAAVVVRTNTAGSETAEQPAAESVEQPAELGSVSELN